MSRWKLGTVPFKFQLSDWTLFSIPLSLQMRTEKLDSASGKSEADRVPVEEIEKNSRGFLIRGLPVPEELPAISRMDGFIRYVPHHYQHCYIDLGMSFEDYQQKFSSKTRSTIRRKIRKYSEHCKGDIPWKAYKTPEEIREFIRLARSVSKLTYQERLLDAGIPDSEEFISEAERLASEGRVRAYLLFDGERPVSYLYCPVKDDTLIYAYLGYDPDYQQMSVGTILQWLAMEELFGENRFRYFDFTEGESDHKRLFATNQRQCANVFLLRKNVQNALIVYAHHAGNRFSEWLGRVFDRLGLKTRIRHFLRFGRQAE